MKLKKILALTLALAMSASLCACGGGEEAPAPEAEGGDAAATLKIGGIGPLTGAVATYGVATQRGAQIAVDEINAMEDKAFAIEYDFQDDTGVAETAVSAYNTLKDWGVDVIYGTTTTGPCITIASETNADRIFQLTPSASSPDVTAGKDNVFQMCFTDPNQGVTAANYVKDTGLATKVGVIYNNGDAYSTGIAQGFIAQCASLGIEVVTEQTFPADTNTDFNVQLTACKDGGAELVFMPIYYTPASLVLTQADAMGYDPIFFGGDGMDGILNIEGFDTALAEGLLLLTPFNATSEDEMTANFVAKYQEAYGEVPNQFAADGYDCIYAIYNAVQQIDGALEMDQAALCDALIAVFTSADFSVDGLTGAGMTWQANGEVAKEALVVAVKDGAYAAQ
ncbi:MAG: ABC transporter substrate-binding protein [Ruminiclostridium sp.]|nr:ABC transporter substrate-binding protein [Ruminiclostridium sp.]